MQIMPLAFKVSLSLAEACSLCFSSVPNHTSVEVLMESYLYGRLETNVEIFS